MNTPTRIQFPPLFTLIFFHLLSITSTATIPRQLIKGLTVTPDPTVTNFQPLLTDHTGNYSLSFLRVNDDQLALTIIHVPSGVPLWQPGLAHLARWGDHTRLLFNGSLIFTDPTSGVFWSTHTTDGDHVSLTASPNLQIWRQGSVLLWQSFDFPYNTLMENQNFTSAMQLVSSNGLYTMRLGPDFIGLYAKFRSSAEGGDSSSDADQIYFRHRALQAKANILVGHGPVLVRISADGFLGMYQNGSVPADVQSFNSYLRSVSGPRRVRMESDGNLRGYYWSGSGWELDYQAIHDPCDLPSPCGPYGLCRPGGGCSCLDNKTQARPGECYPTRPEYGDFCGGKRVGYRALRRTNVELPFKDLMGSTRTSSYGLCENLCATNCMCWGALFNNASGLCYTVDYPIETIIEVGDESKMGYFKVWEGARKKGGLGLGLGIGLLCGGIVVLLSVLVFGGCKLWKIKNRKKNMFLEEEDIVCSGPYKDLGSQSFGSIELSSNR